MSFAGIATATRLEQIASILADFRNRRILVVGDFMLDEYLWGHIERISPEAPVPVLRVVKRELTMGGAGNVVKNLAGFGAQVFALGVVGDDAAGALILEHLQALGVECSGVRRDAGRQSTRKSRLMSLEHGQQVFRFDEELAHGVGAAAEDFLIDRVRSLVGASDAVLCSDYAKGVLTPRVLQAAIQAARGHGKPSVVGPKESNPEKYRGATVLIPNATELAQIAQVVPNGASWPAAAALNVVNSLGVGSLLVTRGADGMSLFESTPAGMRRADIPTVARSVYDVTGAGDTVVSVFTLAITSGADYETAGRLANVAAGVVVGKRGAVGVTEDEILEHVREDRS